MSFRQFLFNTVLSASVIIFSLGCSSGPYIDIEEDEGNTEHKLKRNKLGGSYWLIDSDDGFSHILEFDLKLKKICCWKKKCLCNHHTYRRRSNIY